MDYSLLQDILIILVGAIIFWLKKFIEKEFDDAKTNLNNINNNFISAINKIETNISNLNASINTISQKNAQNQNQHIHIYSVPEVIKTNPEEIKETTKQNESSR